MKCEKCEDKGFTEQEHGLIMILCDCEKGGTKRAELMGEVDDGNSRTEQLDTAFGSTDTSQSKRTRKPKIKKGTRKGTG